MNLQLSLKTQWFEMTKAGIKTEDYRELNDYWYKRLINPNFRAFAKARLAFNFTMLKDQSLNKIIQNKLSEEFEGCFKKFTTNTMTLGYPKLGDNERIIKFEHAGIEIRTGNAEWGAEPNKLYFVIKHGKLI